MKKKIIVVGGGFAGIQLVRNLDKEIFDVILIDKLNHHQFQPLFYQVATSQIEPSSISFPLRYIFKAKRNVQIRLAEVLRVDQAANKVITTIGEFSYDYLVIAIGCKTNFYGNEKIQQYSFTLKSTYDAIKIRNHILYTFEKIISSNEDELEEFFNLVIVGGGATGVELAGAFADIKKNILPKDYHGIDFSKLMIILIEGSKDTLNNMSYASKKDSKNYLKKMGVILLSETFVLDYDGKTLKLSNGEFICSRTVIWVAGVIGNKIEGFADSIITQANRLRVDRTNKVINTENIYAIGDVAFMTTQRYPNGHPQVANVAINQARLLAKNLKSIILNRKSIEFEYKDLGMMATIGWSKAVVDFPFIHFKGILAWLVWMFLHLMLILSVKNKLIIFINWAWLYFTKNTSLSLILKEEK